MRAELHQFRIASKRFRYSLELFAPLYGPSLNPLLGRIKSTQDLLGDVNDCETVREMISQYKGADGLIVLLRKRQRKRIAEFRRYWSKAFFVGAERRSWIDFLRNTTGKSIDVKKPIARRGAASEPQRGRAVA